MLLTRNEIATLYTHPHLNAIPAPGSWLGEGLRQLTLFPAMRLFLNIEISGVDNLSSGGPYIFAANHASHLDAPLLLAALPLHLRMRTRIAAAADYFFTNRLKGAAVSTLLNTFPFERKGAGCAASLAYCKDLLSTGHSLLIFPEGTRSRDGQIHPFKRGAAKLALSTACQVIPTRIDGTFAALPKGAHRLQQHNVRISFGAPLDLSTVDNVEKATSMIEQAVRRDGERVEGSGE